MARWAIGDVQGCNAELGALLKKIDFNADRDRLWLCGDLVNRGPDSLGVLRRVRALGDNALTVLGNHDLHLLAIAFGAESHRLRKRDTLSDILAAPDRNALIDWLVSRPLAHHDVLHGDLLVHAGLVPQWSPAQVRVCAGEVEQTLRHDPRKLFDHMYGDEPSQWQDSLSGWDRLRFIINVLTRMRACTAEGRIDLKQKDAPTEIKPPWMPWFKAPDGARRGTRVIFGHWSTLGFHRGHGVVGMDTGCVWGGRLTALNLDEERVDPVSVASQSGVALESGD
ncbi:MAG TPA: symmetrical bis(5'-nucleosyl)-tetraphosphatase [Steroidobacteraceae bacterium]|nr:symmetrical bis(5'-nucleosyl)-tetraphosphatase [Steroidobacteraceae bacterium]